MAICIFPLPDMNGARQGERERERMPNFFLSFSLPKGISRMCDKINEGEEERKLARL